MQSTLLTLPAEIRNNILDFVFERAEDQGYKDSGCYDGTLLDESYSSKQQLQCLLSCRQLFNDAGLLAFHRTTFVVTNLFLDISTSLASLRQAQIEAIRSIAFVADARHFRKLHISHWRGHAFGVPALNLDVLTIVLHRSSAWHYLFDFTANIVQLLRSLKGVKSLVIVRNKASVKGSFRTWYNRLVGLILKVDHHERFNVHPPVLETTWWSWSFDDKAQVIRLDAQLPRPEVDEVTYVETILPLVDQLMKSVENEEWNPDPRSWSG